MAHKVGPTIAGGNAVVHKPATVTTLSALKLGEVLIEAMPEATKLNCEEVFGPVVNPYKVALLDEAIGLANNVKFGLHDAIFTRRLESAFQAIRELEVGGVMVNNSTNCRIDTMPFGRRQMEWLGVFF